VKPNAGPVATCLLLLFSPCAIGNPQARDPLRDDIKRLIVRIETKFGDRVSYGTGLVVGAANDQIYIITANHVVRDGDRKSQEVTVEFYTLQGKPIKATLQSQFDPNHDLAVLTVPNAKANGVDENSFPYDRVGDPALLARGDPVFLAGHPNDVRWSLSVTPDGFVETEGDWLRFESKSLFPGHSGGALLNFRLEIVGMLRSDKQPYGEALSITKILELLKGWNVPVKLRQRFVAGNVETLSAGAGHTCYVNSHGMAFCWGSNSDGELGNGMLSESPQPSAVRGGSLFVSISAGFGHTCAITASATALCWGENESGELGSDVGKGSRSPVPVSGGLNFAAVSAGFNHTCGLATNGVAYCWGDNEYGQLGTGKKADSIAPAPVAGGHSFRTVRTGTLFSCAITTAGDAYCWGLGSRGQLGNGSKTNSTVPVLVSGGLHFVSLATGDGHACGVTAQGKGYCWGDNEYGQLGNGTTTPSLVPAPVAGGLIFEALSTGKTFSCGVTKEGAAHCWGWGDDTVVATEGDASANAPAPVFASRGLVFKSVTTGQVHACALTTVGEVYCWGANKYGQLGNGSKDDSVRPVAVPAQP
jgi:alpha-tubulin suppressor-like RCC1 family protein